MTKQPFSAVVRSGDGAVTIDLAGEIDGFADEGLNAAYAEAESFPGQTIVLNFSAVHYINSTGIALIVGLLSRARQGNRKLAVFGLSEHYLEIFRITRLADFIDIFPDETSALQALA